MGIVSSQCRSFRHTMVHGYSRVLLASPTHMMMRTNTYDKRTTFPAILHNFASMSGATKQAARIGLHRTSEELHPQGTVELCTRCYVTIACSIVLERMHRDYFKITGSDVPA
ncbi:hypothetical protein M3J09_006383 [Ascochyta lentis]